MIANRLLSTITLALAALSAVAFAQVREVPGGRALDANPQVGSGGSNAPVPGYTPVNANDVITGNVSGLSYFHGTPGTTSTYAFRGTLGTATQNNFYRLTAPTGTGLNQVYFLPSSTVSTAQGNLYSAPMGSGFDSRLIPRTAVAPTVSSAQISEIEPVTSGAPIRAFDRAATPALEAGAPGTELSSPLFGLRLHGPEVVPPEPLQAQPATQPSENGTPAPDSVNDPVRGTLALNTPKEPARNTLATNIGDQTRITGTYLTLQAALEKAQAEAEAANPVTETPATPPTRTAMNPTKRAPITEKTTSGMIEGTVYQSLDPAKANYMPHKLLLERLRAVENQPTETLQAGRKLPPVKSLAETTAGKITPFDTLMKNAEDLLKNEKYLDAADAYQSALMVEPNNPLALIGRAHAELGAGMYSSAAYDLKFVFTKKPELVAVRYDIEQFIPAPRLHMILTDLAEMSKAKSTGNNASFLYCYLTYNSGRTTELQDELDRWNSRKWHDNWQAVAVKAWSPSGGGAK